MTAQQPEPQPVEDWEQEFKVQRERSALGNNAFQDVTRVVLITEDGEYPEYWADSWEVHIQDGGKTVKLIAKGNSAEAIAARNSALADLLGVSSEEAAAFTQAVAESDGQPDRFRGADEKLCGATSARARQATWLQNGGLEQMSSTAQRDEVWR